MHWTCDSSSLVFLSCDWSLCFYSLCISVEDIQWSPSEGSVFCSCSADKSVRVWDVRAKAPQISLVDVHPADVNVISWNRHVSYLLASGADDGSFKVRSQLAGPRVS